MTSRPRQAFKVLAWIPVGIFLSDHAYSIASITGRSMQPTFNPDSSELIKDVVLLNRYSAVRASAGQQVYKVGDVIALCSPLNPSTLLIKRITALPGQIISPLPPSNEKKLVRVPRGHLWIEGDDPFHSRDSNHFGAVPMGLVDSTVDWVVWPPSRIGPLPPPSPSLLKRINRATELGESTHTISGGGRVPKRVPRVEMEVGSGERADGRS